MKDYEEKQAQLKKENFNLKLRIYFLEERLGQINGVKDKEEAIKKNIELKVENESMRKELSEKHELLCQAAKALDMLENQFKDEKLSHAKDIGALEKRIQELEKVQSQSCHSTLYLNDQINRNFTGTFFILQEVQDHALLSQQMKFSAMTQSTDSQYSSACFEVDQLASQVQDLQEQVIYL